MRSLPRSTGSPEEGQPDAHPERRVERQPLHERLGQARDLAARGSTPWRPDEAFERPHVRLGLVEGAHDAIEMASANDTEHSPLAGHGERAAHREAEVDIALGDEWLDERRQLFRERRLKLL
eukprot:4901766-Prymnesium_polylepis.2